MTNLEARRLIQLAQVDVAGIALKDPKRSSADGIVIVDIAVTTLIDTIPVVHQPRQRWLSHGWRCQIGFDVDIAGVISPWGTERLPSITRHIYLRAAIAYIARARPGMLLPGTSNTSRVASLI